MGEKANAKAITFSKGLHLSWDPYAALGVPKSSSAEDIRKAYRKLAKELNRSAAEVIGVLHALGYQKYRSPEDLISDQVEARLRKGIQSGVTPLHVELSEPTVPQASADALSSVAANVDLMAALEASVKAAKDARKRHPAGGPHEEAVAKTSASGSAKKSSSKAA